ncbi:60S ribosomal protein L13 [Sorochytrium milnesiophthora]
MKHNNQLPNQHFRKHWQTRVKTWFDQPGKKKSRRIARAAKAARIAPRPVDGLVRPAVRCPSVRYNRRLRAGKGFTLEELKAAGVARKEALTIGISVDFRRKNRSEESLARNVQRLKTYKSKLIVFPKRNKKNKGKLVSAEEIASHKQLTGPVMPVVNERVEEEPREVTEKEKNFEAYATLRKVRSNAKFYGVRKMRAKAKADAEADAKK